MASDSVLKEDSKIKVVGVVGKGNLTYTIALALLQLGYKVQLLTDDLVEAEQVIAAELNDMSANSSPEKIGPLCPVKDIQGMSEVSFVVLITPENAVQKQEAISELEEILSSSAIIAINTESIALDELQRCALQPSRLIGLNWTEPAHTTRFLEIITNNITPASLVEYVTDLAKSWNKDAYTVINLGIRSRLMSAMIREAFYLVENGYATREDIDRACRNDAGYYLPFAGNCRYMDLMGTYAYGLVMKDLNPDLSRDQDVPEFFDTIVRSGGMGMENGNGIYQYSPEEVKMWRRVFSEFSYLIESLINKYPFNYRHQDRA